MAGDVAWLLHVWCRPWSPSVLHGMYVWTCMQEQRYKTLHSFNLLSAVLSWSSSTKYIHVFRIEQLSFVRVIASLKSSFSIIFPQNHLSADQNISLWFLPFCCCATHSENFKDLGSPKSPKNSHCPFLTVLIAMLCRVFFLRTSFDLTELEKTTHKEKWRQQAKPGFCNKGSRGVWSSSTVR